MTTWDDNGEKQRALYVNTSLNTHLILFVSPLLTFSHLKQMILLEHLRCFPDFGYIEVNAFKVKRKGVYYRVVDSMLVKAAFHGVSTDWFLSVEASRKTSNGQTPVDTHVVIEPPTTLVMNNSHSDDLLGKNEVKSQQGNSSAKKRKRRKRKCGDDGKVETVYRYEESLATESHLKSVGNDTSIQNIVVDETSPASLVKKKRKVKNDNVQDTPLLDTRFSDPNKSTSEAENIINKIDGEDIQNSGLVHSNELSSEPPETAKVFSRRKKGKRHATHEPMNLDIEVKEKEKNVSIVAVGVSEVVTVQPLSLQLEGATTNPPEHFNDGKGNDSVNVTEKTVQEPLASTKREIEEESDPLESSKAKGIEESENTGKKKKSRKSKRSVTEKLEICSTENHQDVGNDVPTNESAEDNVDGSRHTTSTTVSDISKLDVTLAENENRIDQDYIEVTGVEKTVQETQTEEKENTSKKKKSRKSTRSVTEKLEKCNTENHQVVGSDIPTNESAEDNVDGSLRIASITVSDISKVDFALVQNVNRIEKDYIEVTGVEKTVQETHTEEKENTSKKKKSRKSTRSVTEKLEICSTENHQDVGNDVPSNESAEDNVDGSRHTTSTTVSDISKFDVTLAENENRIDQDYFEVTGVEKTVQESQTEEKENTSKKKKSRKSTRSVTEKLEICNTENHRDVGNDIPTNESTEDNVDGSLRIASTTVSDISKVDFALVKNENRVEKDYIEVTGVEKTVQETHTEEKENTSKKKKSRKSTRSVTEKSDVGNDAPVNGPYEYNNDKHGSTNEVEDACEADKEKPVNEIVEVGNTAKKKKSKKGKKSSAEKAKLEEVTDIGQNNVMTRDTKSDTLSSPSVVIEADDMKEVGVKSLLLSEMEKTGDDVKVETDEIIKRVCNDLTDLSKDHLEHPAEEQLGEKMSEPHSTKKKAKTRNITSYVATSAADNEKAENAIQLEGGGVVKDARKIETEALHPCQVIKPKEDVEIGDDKFTESDRGEETIVKKSPGLSAEKHFVEETSEMVPNSKQACGDFTGDAVDNGSKLQVEVSASKNLCEEFNGIPIPEISADVSNSKKKQHKSKGRAKKLDFPSSVDTSSDGPYPPKSQKHKGTEKTPHDANEKHPTMSKQGKKSQVHNPLNSESEDAIKEDIKVASVCDGGKSSGPSSVNSGYSLRGRKEKVKPDINVGSRRSMHKKMEVGDTVTKRKGLLVTPGAIFEDKSDASSDEEGENYGSGSSTRTPSDYVSSSDYSEGESTGVVVTSQHDSLKDAEKTANSKKSELERLNLGSVLRRSSRFKEAKVIASQMEESESQFVDFVPDSQAN